MIMNQNPPSKPWVVLRMKPSGGRLHPWFVTLENHYYLPGSEGFLCHWNVALDDDRYDLSRAIKVVEAREPTPSRGDGEQRHQMDRWQRELKR